MNKNLNAKLHPQLIAICLGLFVLFYTIQTCFAETENSIENKVSTKIIERKTQLPINQDNQTISIELNWQIDHELSFLMDDCIAQFKDKTYDSKQIIKEIPEYLRKQAQFYGYYSLNINIQPQIINNENNQNNQNNQNIESYNIKVYNKKISKVVYDQDTGLIEKSVNLNQLLPNKSALQNFDIQKAAENLYRLPGQKNVKVYVSDDPATNYETSILNVEGIKQDTHSFKLAIHNQLDRRVEPYQIESTLQFGNLLKLQDLTSLDLASNLRMYEKKYKYRNANLEWVVPYKNIDIYTRHNFYEMLRKDDSEQPIYAKQIYSNIGFKQSIIANQRWSFLWGANLYYKKFNGFSYDVAGINKSNSSLTKLGSEVSTRVFYNRPNHTFYAGAVLRLGSKNLQPSFDINYLYNPFKTQAIFYEKPLTVANDLLFKQQFDWTPGYLIATANQPDNENGYSSFIFGKTQANIGSYIQWKNQNIYAVLTVQPNIHYFKKADSKRFENIDPANQNRNNQAIQLGAALGIKGELNVPSLVKAQQAKLNYHTYFNIPFNSREKLGSQWLFRVEYSY